MTTDKTAIVWIVCLGGNGSTHLIQRGQQLGWKVGRRPTLGVPLLEKPIPCPSYPCRKSKYASECPTCFVLQRIGYTSNKRSNLGLLWYPTWNHFFHRYQSRMLYDSLRHPDSPSVCILNQPLILTHLPKMAPMVICIRHPLQAFLSYVKMNRHGPDMIRKFGFPICQASIEFYLWSNYLDYRQNCGWCHLVDYYLQLKTSAERGNTPMPVLFRIERHRSDIRKLPARIRPLFSKIVDSQNPIPLEMTSQLQQYFWHQVGNRYYQLYQADTTSDYRVLPHENAHRFGRHHTENIAKL